ncbi:hypothetical protein T4B_12397, partial [Trichinella pseudospiralis]
LCFSQDFPSIDTHYIQFGEIRFFSKISNFRDV